MSFPVKQIYEFGDFVFDPAERLLLRGGQPVPLSGKAFDTLVVLVENNGRVVTKETLLARVWPGVAVESNNLDKSISAIRKALGADGAQFITTVRGFGYRFSDRNSVEPTVVEPPAAELPAVPERRRRRVPLLAAALVVTIAAGAIAAAWLLFKPRGPAFTRLVPVTSYPQSEVDSRLSPDGRFVAFSWQGPDALGAWQIYVKQADAGDPLRVSRSHLRTNSPVRAFSPAWSPDGRYVAYIVASSVAEECGIFVVPALGGNERRVYSFRHQLLSAAGLDWAPDGKSLLFVTRPEAGQPFRLTILSLETSQTRSLPAPPRGWLGDTRPRFSPDGQSIAFVRATGNTSDLFVIGIGDAAPRRLTWDNGTIRGVSWMPDGRRLVFDSDRSGTSSLWRIPSSGGTPEPLGIENAFDPSIARNGGRLTFTRILVDTNIYRYAIGASDEPMTLFASTRNERTPSLSPDGRRVAFVSDRSGAYQLWAGASDGSESAQLTAFRGAAPANPRWSPDGQHIAFESRLTDGSRICTIAASGGAPQCITDGRFNDSAPEWSRDGRSIYFGSDRGRSWQVWKVPAAGGAPHQVTTGGGFEAVEWPDERTLYFTKHDQPGVFRRTAGGPETLVLNLPQMIYDSWGEWTVTPQGIYFVDRADPNHCAIRLRRPDGNMTTIVTFHREPPEDPGINVSPDGHWLLLGFNDISNYDILMAENFR